ncbi:zinc finger protein STAMENLESS 1-like [Zingiber officinale]|uniref:zinc finger protein STAMENLESS 1-like n=1 Tax=Zingiber officinale TaxID=94328 RepID=UPI001C4C588F|nr:zinc finger protein STAMENLESS 1-like [Zingiber officinale]
MADDGEVDQEASGSDERQEENAQGKVSSHVRWLAKASFSPTVNCQRAEENSLDLNNYPDEHGKPPPAEESTMTSAASVGTTRTGLKKKKGLGNDEAAKVYECRFCSLKFCKSQALGGHMNRHRQERETETLDRARQLVFSTEGLAGAASAVRGFQHGAGLNGEPFLQFRPAVVYPNAPAVKQYMYPSSSAASSPYQHPAVICNYYVGHVVSGGSQSQALCGPHQDPSFTCYGAPLSRSFPVEEARLATARDSGAPYNLSLS